ncbi:MAG: aromatic ring-hydroxylating dioxygenase subunit alpha [Porticoccaceae bacterium]|nr:aromatic ring-hydroxylating dioxygenase subunit alpha [Porticoccaceae bacterium]
MKNPDESINWAEVRAQSARESQRKQVHMLKHGNQLADAALPLHKSVYIDQSRFDAEQKHIFLAQPLVACLSGDIPNPGDTVLFDAAGPSIIVSRGKDGTARAFLNMCTHRGAKLVEEAEPWAGVKNRLTCPFHAWTFDNTGRLIGQPGKEAFADCPEGGRDLIELPCAEHIGLVFVKADPDAGDIDAEAFLGDYGDILTQLELWRAEPVKKGVLTADSNWKFALDTYGESYHFGTLHKTTLAHTNYTDKQVFETFGKHHRIEFPKLSTGNLIDIDESEWPETIYGGVHYLFPNTIIFFGAVADNVFFTQVFRLFPDGVGKTRCQFAVYAPFGIESDLHKGSCIAAYDATATVVQEEDYRVASNGYANLLTAPDSHHVVLGANEWALQVVHQHIAKVIGMPLD